LRASAAYGYEGKQYLARITGRDPKFTFRREFIGRKSGKRGETTEADVDTPGLYLECDVDKKGKEESFRLVFEHEGELRALYMKKENAMIVARRIDDGERLSGIVKFVTEGAELRYVLIDKPEAKPDQTPTDKAIENCWSILQALPSKEIENALTALRMKAGV